MCERRALGPVPVLSYQGEEPRVLRPRPRVAHDASHASHASPQEIMRVYLVLLGVARPRAERQ